MSTSVVIHSDCGLASVRFAQLAGLIETLAPDTDVVSGSLNFDAQDPRIPAAYLYSSVPFWPAGTVFLNDAGNAEIAVCLADNRILVGPDNGFVTACCAAYGFGKAVRLSDAYGNDGYQGARACAALVNGTSFEDLGQAQSASEIVLFRMPEAHVSEGLAEGEVMMLLKTFGNITFSIGTDEFEKTGITRGDAVEVTFTHEGRTVYHETMTYQPSFGYVPEGEPVVFNGSSGYMDIGLNRRNFIEECLPQVLDAEDPAAFKVSIRKIGG